MGNTLPRRTSHVAEIRLHGAFGEALTSGLWGASPGAAVVLDARTHGAMVSRWAAIARSAWPALPFSVARMVCRGRQFIFPHPWRPYARQRTKRTIPR